MLIRLKTDRTVGARFARPRTAKGRPYNKINAKPPFPLRFGAIHDRVYVLFILNFRICDRIFSCNWEQNIGKFRSVNRMCLSRNTK